MGLIKVSTHEIHIFIPLGSFIEKDNVNIECIAPAKRMVVLAGFPQQRPQVRLIYNKHVQHFTPSPASDVCHSLSQL